MFPLLLGEDLTCALSVPKGWSASSPALTEEVSQACPGAGVGPELGRHPCSGDISVRLRRKWTETARGTGTRSGSPHREDGPRNRGAVSVITPLPWGDLSPQTAQETKSVWIYSDGGLCPNVVSCLPACGTCPRAAVPCPCWVPRTQVERGLQSLPRRQLILSPWRLASRQSRWGDLPGEQGRRKLPSLPRPCGTGHPMTWKLGTGGHVVEFSF